MLDSSMRTAILRLARAKHSNRKIAKLLGVSRNSVKKVIRAGTDEVPAMNRVEVAEKYLDDIRSLYTRCAGNLVRVHEELAAKEIELAYSTLTAICRRHEIGTKPKQVKGRYYFAPGEEMQHDTSPHRVVIAGKERLVQCASLVCCYSRVLFAQAYPTFNRFYCKLFLSDAFRFLEGVCDRCMIDNTHVVVAGGSGKNAIIAPEMAGFATHFGFDFVAHEIGDANRSARVEGPFYFIERNFYPGRDFEDLADLNRKMTHWCREKSKRVIRTLGSRPIDLYETERVHLRPLPAFIPDVYAVHHRLVDLEGYVHLHTNLYSVPADFIGQRVEVRETRDCVELFIGPRRVAEHKREPEGARIRVTVSEHCPPGRRRPKGQRRRSRCQEEKTLRHVAPEFGQLLDALVRTHGYSIRRIRRLQRMYLDYPTDPLRQAIREALTYRMTDLARIEQMALRRIAGDYFKLDTNPSTMDPNPDKSNE